MSAAESSERKNSAQEVPSIAFTSPFGSPTSDRRMSDDRRQSDEWDASKVPPSRFQKRKGSIYAVPSSRDGHVDSNYQAKFHEKHMEKGYNKIK